MQRFHSICICLVALSSGCSFLIDRESAQCTKTAECTARGAAFADAVCRDGYCELTASEPEVKDCTKDGDCESDESCVEDKCESRWACLGEASAEMLSTAPIVASIPVRDITGMPLPGVQAKGCRSIDPDCAVPFATPVTDEGGLLHLTLPAGSATATYYVEIAGGAYFPQMYFLPTGLKASVTLPGMSLAPPNFIAGLAGAVGASLDETRGQILVSTSSCLGAAPNVEFAASKADATTIPFYVYNSIPVSDQSATSVTGSGGYLNFPPGNASVALQSSSGLELATLGLTVRAGYMTALNFNPLLK